MQTMLKNAAVIAIMIMVVNYVDTNFLQNKLKTLAA